MLNVILVISLAVGLGLHAHLLLEGWGIKLPVFVTCLFGAFFVDIANTMIINNVLGWLG